MEMEKAKDPQHQFPHLERVVRNALKIVGVLKIDLDKNLLMAACYLHDINHSEHSPSLLNYFSETKVLRRILPEILQKFDLSSEENKVIERAIYNHSYSFPFKRLNKDGDVYSRVLQDADTIDFFSKEREKDFSGSKKKFFFYKLISPFSNWAFSYGRKNLKNYLNFSELVGRMNV